MSHGTMKYHRLTILALLLLFELPRHRVTADATMVPAAAPSDHVNTPSQRKLDHGCPGWDTYCEYLDDKCADNQIMCFDENFLKIWSGYYCHNKTSLDTAADEATPASFGSGIEVFGKTDSTRYPFDGQISQISWVVELNGIGLGLCDSTRHEFHVWNTVNGAGIDNLHSVALAPLSNPVGAIHSQVESNLVYIACFGTWPTPIKSDSGIAIVDISNIEQPVLVRTVAYPDPRMHVHNVYEFDFLQGSGSAVVPEITAAVLGNPWLKPALPGHGLVQLDRRTGNFRPLVVNEKEGDVTTNRLNVRSAKQAAPGIFYAVTQEAAGVATQVVRLEQTTPEANTPHELKIVARSVLPTRNGGDGGADVVLGLQPNTVWVSDRWNQAGRLYYYKYHPPSTTVGDGTFDRVATHVATGGDGARYTMITHTGDIVVCNDSRTDPVLPGANPRGTPRAAPRGRDSGTLTVMKGLALNPQSNPEVVTIDTVPTVQFFLESTLLPSSSVALPIASPIANQKKKFKKSKK